MHIKPQIIYLNLCSIGPARVRVADSEFPIASGAVALSDGAVPVGGDGYFQGKLRRQKSGNNCARGSVTTSELRWRVDHMESTYSAETTQRKGLVSPTRDEVRDRGKGQKGRRVVKGWRWVKERGKE